MPLEVPPDDLLPGEKIPKEQICGSDLTSLHLLVDVIGMLILLNTDFDRPIKGLQSHHLQSSW